MTDLESAINDLRKRRKRVMDELFAAQPELGLALQRLDAAIEALEGGVPVNVGPAKRRRRRPSEGSVRHKAQRLMDEFDQAWNYDEIIDAWVLRGEPIEAEQPKAALRTALAAMVKAGDAVRVEEGVFKSAKWTTDPTVDRHLADYVP